MKRKGIFTILGAVFMVLAFSAMAFAANIVVMKTTVPNIPQSACYQAGTDTMEFDNGTTIREGDVIELTLNNGVTICKKIDMFLTLANTAGVLDITGAQPVSDPGAGTITAAPAGLQWGFRIQGAIGSQIIRMTFGLITTATGVMPAAGATTMTYTAVGAPTDKMILKLWDGKGVGTFATSGFQKSLPATPAVYDTAIVAGDNVLCINTLAYSGEYVQNTPNSIPVNTAQKLSFSGDYVVAHILGSVTSFGIVNCKETLGRIEIGNVGTQATDTCQYFDFELASPAASTNGYCPVYNVTLRNRLVVGTAGTFAPGNYRVKAQIIVERNGVAKAIPGVYWSNAGFGWVQSATLTTAGTGACFAGPAALGGVYTYLRADGATAAAPIAPIVPAVGSCSALTTAGAASKASFVETDLTVPMAILAGQSYLYLDMPAFNYDLAEIAAGDVVKIKIWLLEEKCNSIELQPKTIGTFGCDPASVSGTCLFPYFTSLQGGDYWNGIAIINPSAVAGTVTLTAYQRDGSVATFTTPSIPARGLYVNLLENITWAGAVSGESLYISVASGNFKPEGFAMMANGAHDSMGYVCKY